MRESSHRPLIFGTPFLSTVGAIFDFPNQRISFNKVNKGMFFPMCSTKNSFVDMVQEEKVTLKPPQEGETEEQSRKIPFLSPSSLPNKQGVRLRPLHQNRPRDQPRLKMRPSQEEAVDSRRKTWRIKTLYLLLSAKPYSQAKDLKQALHGRQPMRIEGEKGVKTQSAPNHWPRTRKREFWPSNSNRADRHGRAGKEWLVLGRITIARQNVRATHEQGKVGRDRPIFVSERTDRAGRSGKQRSASAEISRPNKIWPTKSLDRDKIHRPSAQTFLGQGKSPFH
ncbi:unnamed protein product [Microthlaspi erraticum]|uniref:Uncharacterized protein n=1 Tax=Microthlaspi erraticum TaxID=1685480 RepID=A0A6D2K1M5_9BRAS|nr:unnamed protein product [Microthlaspi erraticum]